MNAIIASFVGAMILGAADFCGGLASKRTRTVIVGLVGQSIGLVVVIAIIAIYSVPIAQRALTCGIGAGCFGGIALLTLYKGLAIGRVALVAPVSAVLGAAIPVLFSLLTGHDLNLLTWLAIALGLVAVYLLSIHGDEHADAVGPSGLKYGVVSGVCVGGFFVMLGHPEANGNIWTLLGERTTIILMFALLLLLRRSAKQQADRKAMSLAVTGGCCDIAANLLYLWSSAHGPLHMVALLTSLYPASTILLGWTVLKERLNRRIAFGALCALGSIALFAAQ